jgi:hypothetical protein
MLSRLPVSTATCPRHDYMLLYIVLHDIRRYSFRLWGITTEVSPQLRELGHLGNYLSEAFLSGSVLPSPRLLAFGIQRLGYILLLFSAVPSLGHRDAATFIGSFCLPPYLADATSLLLALYIFQRHPRRRRLQRAVHPW